VGPKFVWRLSICLREGRAELQWGTVAGGWVVEDYYHFKGKKYKETTSSLGKFNIDPTAVSTRAS